MKCNTLTVLLENKSGGVYQVALTKNEMEWVLNLISQLHNGVIKALPGEASTHFHKEKIVLTLLCKYFKVHLMNKSYHSSNMQHLSEIKPNE